MKNSVFDVQKLQEDIVKAYLVGKPLVRKPEDHLRVCFKFRVAHAETISMGVSKAHLELLSKSLTEDFKVIMGELTIYFKNIQFHTSNNSDLVRKCYVYY